MSEIKVGKSPKGTVLHMLFVHNGKVHDRAHCDKKQTGLVEVKDAGPADITCAKCSKLTVVKEAIGAPDKQKQDIGLTKPTPKATPKKKPKPTPKVKPKPAPKKKTPPKRVEDYDFVAQQKGELWNIYHRPSKRVFFEGLPNAVIDIAVSNMNDMQIRWTDVNESIPKDFISGCRLSLKEAYEKAGLNPPKFVADEKKPKKKAKGKKVPPKSETKKFKKGDELEFNGVMHVFDGKKWKKKPEKPKRTIKRRAKKAEKPKRVIKRRGKPKAQKPKKSKRQIKRRQKPESKKEFDEQLNQFGMKPDRPPAAIVEYLEGEGAQFDEIVEMLMDRFKLSERRAKAKLKGIVNKLARKVGAQVMITLGEDESVDHYRLC